MLTIPLSELDPVPGGHKVLESPSPTQWAPPSEVCCSGALGCCSNITDAHTSVSESGDSPSASRLSMQELSLASSFAEPPRLLIRARPQRKKTPLSS